MYSGEGHNKNTTGLLVVEEVNNQRPKHCLRLASLFGLKRTSFALPRLILKSFALWMLHGKGSRPVPFPPRIFRFLHSASVVFSGALIIFL